MVNSVLDHGEDVAIVHKLDVLSGNEFLERGQHKLIVVGDAFALALVASHISGFASGSFLELGGRNQALESFLLGSEDPQQVIGDLVHLGHWLSLDTDNGDLVLEYSKRAKDNEVDISLLEVDLLESLALHSLVGLEEDHVHRASAVLNGELLLHVEVLYMD